MKNSQLIAFFDLPDHTRITTTLAIAEGLINQGVKLDYYCLENSRSLVESIGVDFHNLPPFRAKIKEETLQYRVIEYALDAVPILLPLLQQNPPCLIIFTGKCLWAAVLADCLNIPSVCIHTNYLLPISYFPTLSVLCAGYPPRFIARHLRLYWRDLKLWQVLQKKYALKNILLKDLFKWQPNCINLRGTMNLVYVAEEFQEQATAFNSSYHFVGPCYNARPFDNRSDIAEEFTVYIALGSVSLYNQNINFYRQCIKAFAGSVHKVLIAVGNALNIKDLGELPDNISVVNYAPQLEILHHAQVFVTHGGTNSVWEALLQGVPMVLFPQGGDQYLVANRVDELKLGVWNRNPDISAEALYALVEEVMADTEIRRNIEQMGNTFRQAGSTTKAVDKIMAFMAEY